MLWVHCVCDTGSSLLGMAVSLDVTKLVFCKSWLSCNISAMTWHKVVGLWCLFCEYTVSGAEALQVVWEHGEDVVRRNSCKGMLKHS